MVVINYGNLTKIVGGVFEKIAVLYFADRM
jgi:hypothetical protein